MGQLVRLCWVVCALALLAAPTAAQQTGVLRSPVLIVDSERLYFESEFGQRQEAEFKARARALNEKNAEIAAALEAEEIALRDERDTMEPDAFRVLADAFDAKVTQTRQAQVAESNALTADLEKNRDAFRAVARPVLAELMRESGAAVILDERSVYLFVNAIDVTEQAIAQLDETLGSGDPVDK